MPSPPHGCVGHFPSSAEKSVKAWPPFRESQQRRTCKCSLLSACCVQAWGLGVGVGRWVLSWELPAGAGEAWCRQLRVVAGSCPPRSLSLLQRGPEEESLLRTLSFVGCGVSFCALSTTFLLFLAAG